MSWEISNMPSLVTFSIPPLVLWTATICLSHPLIHIMSFLGLRIACQHFLQLYVSFWTLYIEWVNQNHMDQARHQQAMKLLAWWCFHFYPPGIVPNSFIFFSLFILLLSQWKIRVLLTSPPQWGIIGGGGREGWLFLVCVVIGIAVLQSKTDGLTHLITSTLQKHNRREA